MAPFGFLDPVGFTKVGNKEGFNKLRAADLKHSHVAMKAPIGAVVQRFVKFPFAESARGTFGALFNEDAPLGMPLLLLCCVVMELAAQLETKNAELNLEWAPRDQNAEADALADGRTEGFDPARRAEAEMKSLPWILLPKLMEAGTDHYKQQRTLLQEGGGSRGVDLAAAGKRRKVGERLRDREPW